MVELSGHWFWSIPYRYFSKRKSLQSRCGKKTNNMRIRRGFKKLFGSLKPRPWGWSVADSWKLLSHLVRSSSRSRPNVMGVCIYGVMARPPLGWEHCSSPGNTPLLYVDYQTESARWSNGTSVRWDLTPLNWPLGFRHSRSLKAIGFESNTVWSGICHFLLVTHSNYRPISYRFRNNVEFNRKTKKFSYACI